MERNGRSISHFLGKGLRRVVLWENRVVRNYAVVIHEDPEGGYWGEVPALPGCYSQGETVDELKQNICEAIAGVLEVLRERGQEPDSNIQILDVAV
jgi:predicted RNase H-like HicB family nuclease